MESELMDVQIICVAFGVNGFPKRSEDFGPGRLTRGAIYMSRNLPKPLGLLGASIA